MNPKELSPYSRKVIKSLNDAAIVARMAHWNVRGPNSYECHLLFGRVYDDLSELMDGLVETLRAFQFSPNFSEFSGPGIVMDSFECFALCELTHEYVSSLVASLALFLEAIGEMSDDPRLPALENHIQNISDKALSSLYLLQAYLGL
jgi:hypothetical protein